MKTSMSLPGEIIEVWPNERKLVPAPENNISHQIFCKKGIGYLRVMSDSVVHRILREGDKISIPCDEIITLTGIEHMKVEVKQKTVE